MKAPTLALTLSLWLVPLVLVARASYQADLKYRDRGDRYEGIKGSPVSDRVELISALIDYNEDSGPLPENFKLRFYLSEQSKVFVTVRELDNRRNYWMDRIRPSTDWRRGFGNQFEWPTQEVVSRLGDLRLRDLGALVQLGDDTPSLDMRVAPVILFQSISPRMADKYSFTFRISRKADVTCSFSRDEDGSPVLSTQTFEIPGHRPRAVKWNALNVREGWYRLRIDVVYRNNGQEVIQFVHFFHRHKVE